MTLAPCCLLLTATVALGAADREASVEAGRQALDRWVWQYPWYDSQTDGVRAIRVREPWYVRWEWLLNWFEDFFAWLGNLFTFRGGRLGSMSWLDWLAWGVIAALLIFLTYLIIRIWRRREEKRSSGAVEAGPSDAAEQKRRVEALPTDVGRKRADLLDAARQCYRDGDYREAIIYLFSYQLIRLDKGQLIRLAKGKTNRQYLRELGRRLTLRGLLEQTMVTFEDVFFGNYAIDRARFESVWSRLDEFEALLAGEAA
jgi:hypothetical protein